MLLKLFAFLILLSPIFVAFSASATFLQPCTHAQCHRQPVPVFHKNNEVRHKILTEFHQWEGVRYKLGGVSDKGIDCSALMQEIFDSALETHLPRTTSEQIKKGRTVHRDQLKPGDLIFFHTKKSPRHVGVYVGKHEFVHASSSKGVTVSSLENAYWSGHFEDARRVLG